MDIAHSSTHPVPTLYLRRDSALCLLAQGYLVADCLISPLQSSVFLTNSQVMCMLPAWLVRGPTLTLLHMCSLVEMLQSLLLVT